MRKAVNFILCISLLIFISGQISTSAGKKDRKVNWKGRFKGGQIHYSDNRIDNAIEQFERVLEEKPEHAESYLYLGDCYMAKKNYTTAIENFQKAVELNPKLKKEKFRFRVNTSKDMSYDDLIDHYWTEFFKEGVDEANNRDFESAEKSFGNAVLVDGTRIDAYRNLAVVQINQNKLDDAAANLAKVTKMDPDDMSVHENLGIIYIQQQNFDGAIKEFELILASQPDNEVILENLSLALMNSGDEERAIPVFQKLLELKPDNRDRWYNLGILFHKKEKFPEAIDAFKKVDELSPATLEDYYRQLGINVDDPAEREARQGEVITLVDESVETLLILTRDLFHVERFSEAEEYALKVTELHPEDPESFELLGQVYAKSGKQEKAVKAFERAKELQSTTK